MSTDPTIRQARGMRLLAGPLVVLCATLTIALAPRSAEAATTFPVHVNFLGSDRYGLENVNNLDRIPPRGAVAYVGLIPWEEGSGGPCRVIAGW